MRKLEPPDPSETVVESQMSWFRIPLARPMTDATHTLPAIDVVTLRLRDGEGRTGLGYALGFDYSTDLLAACVRSAGARTLGRPPTERRQVWSEAWEANEYLGRAGLLAWGVAVTDIAVADLRCHQLGVPMHALFGGDARPVPAYGSGGWTSFTVDELVEQTSDYVARGFTGVKVKVGDPDLRVDLDRVRAVRSTVGPAVRIMIDANQALSVIQARDLARTLEPFDITWFEEPISADDLRGYQALRRDCPIPLALGERNYFAHSLRDFVETDATDIVMPDAIRIGGIDEWLATAALAGSAGKGIAPHFYREIDLQLSCAVDNVVFLEHFDWLDEIFDWDATLEGGSYTPSASPGLGLRVRPGLPPELLVEEHVARAPKDVTS
jgi:L-alanine-DL-glutamate epimerase-like enolase superfamily enzyme